MNEKELLKETEEISRMLYQNKEQEAYQKINQVLPEMNRILQGFMGISDEMEKIILSVLTEFVEDFQIRDNLGLADLFGYTVPGIIMAIIESE